MRQFPIVGDKRKNAVSGASALYGMYSFAAPNKSPRDVVFVEAMPLTHLGKVDRGALAKRRTQG